MHSAPAEVTDSTRTGVAMDLLLIIGIALVLLALLGFSGVIAAIRSAAWLILVIALVLVGLAILF